MNRSRSVLVVDDDLAMGEMVAALLEDQGIRSSQASSVDEALEAAADDDFDVVLSDIRMPGRTGVELIGALRSLRPTTPVVLMTAVGTIDSAVEAMRAGAFHYVTKPFKRDEVLAVLERAFEHRSLQQENEDLRRAVDKTTAFGDLLGSSPAMHEIFAMIRKVADSKSNVLITGESGTGKEVVSRTLHFCGSRAKHPYVPVNCAAIPEGLLESELFGHERGAFTGADAAHTGLFEKANGGTLFLDEIGDMGGSLQSKLLRVLQDGEIRRVGGTDTLTVDVRVVAATNKDLPREVEAGRFRQDLFYRLNVIPIHIPPLRERREDIAGLAKAFVERHAGDTPRSLSDAALERLARCNWDGNARELENAIERSLALSDRQELGPDELLLSTAGVDSAGEPRSADAQAFFSAAIGDRLTLRELEERYTDAVLHATNGNKAEAARILGIHRRTLYRRDGAGAKAEDAAANDEEPRQ